MASPVLLAGQSVQQGWYLPIRVFVKDADDVHGWVGPFDTAQAAADASFGVSRGVVHVE